MEESSKKYLLKVSIDYGSTNTVIMYRMYEKNSQGKLEVSRLMPPNNIRSIPTLVALKSENDQLDCDLFGEAAADAQKNGTYKPVTHSNFKQSLYMYMSDTPEFAEGKRLAVLFFGHLLEYFRQEIYGRLVSSEIKDDMETCLYLTTPVRAMPLQNAVMLDIAKEAGFTEVNGVDRVSIECNEAEAVVRHAFSNMNRSIEALIAKAQRESANVIFVDIGGSTTDMSLQRIYLDSRSKKMVFDSLASWPRSEVKVPLGGCEVDEAIKNYLIQKGYADRDFTEKNWNEGNAKFDFRLFKEANNKRLSEGKRIESMGSLDSEIIPKRKMPQVDYDEISEAEKIDREIFIKEICPDYIDRMTQAVRELIQRQRVLDSKPLISQDDIDAVFIFGAGSNMFFVEDIFLGRLGKSPLNLKKIMADNSMLLSRWENPSYCCAMGVLTDNDDSIYNDYADAEYRIRFILFELGSCASLSDAGRDYFLNNPKKFSGADFVELPAEDGGEPSRLDSHFIGMREYVIAEKNSPLDESNKTSKEATVTYTDHWGGGIGVKFFFLKIDPCGAERLICPCKTFVVNRKPTSRLLKIFILAAGVTVKVIFSNLDRIDEIFYNVRDKVFKPREQKLILKSNFLLQKNNILFGNLTIDIPDFEVFDNAIEIQ